MSNFTLHSAGNLSIHLLLEFNSSENNCNPSSDYEKGTKTT